MQKVDQAPSQPPAADAPEQGDDRWSTAVWAAVAVVLLVGMVALYLNVRDSSSSGQLVNAIASGERPVAPLVPGTPLDGADTPALPDWYQPRAGKPPVDAPGAGPMIVNFWTSWCGACHEEAPVLKRLSREYADDGVVVVGINAGAEDLAVDARSFVQEYELGFPVVRATNAEKAAWGVRGFPETFIVGRDGRISARIDGAVEESTLRAAIEQELRR